MRKALLFALIFMFLFVSNSFAHGGRTDSCGGHNNRKTGGYHVHNQAKYNACYPKETSPSTKSKKSLTCDEKIESACDKGYKTCLEVCENAKCQKACLAGKSACE